ncbi:hypothetical protein NKR19_g6340 [Coniochaeta hoffmannii]|uniref:Uncharacterized protein n=1 Tax=Coniochaeta hoffmannii TaxID=91930 RepID=A0AA38VQB2_9PEZI|nr:hypothetical protein NKR19_g6340 [Coniochaeta hoffmannii]
MDCIPAPEFPFVEWPVNETGYYPPTEGYFNLNPNTFGLSFDIFEEEVIVEEIDGTLTTIVTGNWASQTGLSHYPTPSTTSATTTAYGYGNDNGKKPRSQKSKARRSTGKHGANHMNAFSKRDETITPAVCYDTCNDCYLEAQAVGKSPALCAAGSPFNISYTDCNNCINENSGQTKMSTKAYLDPKFAQFINFCQATDARPQPVQQSSAPQSQQSSPPPVQSTTQAPSNTQTTPSPITTNFNTEFCDSERPNREPNDGEPFHTESNRRHPNGKLSKSDNPNCEAQHQQRDASDISPEWKQHPHRRNRTLRLVRRDNQSLLLKLSGPIDRPVRHNPRSHTSTRQSSI